MFTTPGLHLRVEMIAIFSQGNFIDRGVHSKDIIQLEDRLGQETPPPQRKKSCR
jgi:hypothetical protein